MNNYDEYVITALEIINAWDIPDKDTGYVVTQQTKLMSGINSDDPWQDHMDTH